MQLDQESSWSKLSCNVVTFSDESDNPAACCSNALLIPSAQKAGYSSRCKHLYQVLQLIQRAKLIDTHRLTNDPRINIPKIEAPLVMSCNNPPDKSSVILEPAL